MGNCSKWGGLSEEEEDVFTKEEVLIFDEGVADAFCLVEGNGVACFFKALVD